MKSLFSILFLAAVLITPISAQTLVSGQDESMPLYTELTDEILTPYNSLFTKDGFDLEGIKGMRMFLKPYAKNGDPIGMLMYAKAHDLYPFKKGNKADALVALEYFKKASDAGLADASFILYGHYRNGYMNLPKDSHRALVYLHKTIQQGNSNVKAAMLTGLARLHQSSNGETGVNSSFPAVKYNPTMVKHYLQEAVKYNPNNSWAKTELATLSQQ